MLSTWCLFWYWAIQACKTNTLPARASPAGWSESSRTDCFCIPICFENFTFKSERSIVFLAYIFINTPTLQSIKHVDIKDIFCPLYMKNYQFLFFFFRKSALQVTKWRQLHLMGEKKTVRSKKNWTHLKSPAESFYEPSRWTFYSSDSIVSNLFRWVNLGMVERFRRRFTSSVSVKRNRYGRIRDRNN